MPQGPNVLSCLLSSENRLEFGNQWCKRVVSELDEENANSKPTAFNVADPCQEGESAPSKRQVSPDKLYLVVLLRNCFVDTILKSQEKTLSQGDRGDPEKLRHE